MKKHVLTFLTICLLFSLSACFPNSTSQVNGKTDYRPMIFVNNHLFGDTGKTASSISDEWEMLGSIQHVIPQTKPMVHVEFTSNTLRIGDELFMNVSDGDKLYAKIDEDTYLLYEVIE